jgi:four helix bundle protein
MGKIKSYLYLDVWKRIKLLATELDRASQSFPKEETHCLTNQVRRGVISIAPDIAEGSGRQTAKETIQFLYISRGSLYEVEAQLYIASDLEYISVLQQEKLSALTTECKKLRNGYINYCKILTNSN